MYCSLSPCKWWDGGFTAFIRLSHYIMFIMCTTFSPFPQLMQHWCHQAARLMDLEAKFSKIYFPPWVSASSGSIGDFVTPAIIRRNVEFFIATVSLRSSAPAVCVRRGDGYRINCVWFSVHSLYFLTKSMCFDRRCTHNNFTINSGRSVFTAELRWDRGVVFLSRQIGPDVSCLGCVSQTLNLSVSGSNFIQSVCIKSDCITIVEQKFFYADTGCHRWFYVNC